MTNEELATIKIGTHLSLDGLPGIYFKYNSIPFMLFDDKKSILEIKVPDMFSVLTEEEYFLKKMES